MCIRDSNKDGERLGAFSYSDIKIRQDETTGKQFLISEHGTMSYDALVLDLSLIHIYWKMNSRIWDSCGHI